MDKQLATNVYHFCDDIFSLIVDEFNGKTIGEDDFGKQEIMTFLFDDYVPGKKPKKEKVEKKEKKEKKKKKKEKKLSGYTFYGQMNKESINSELKKRQEETEEKVRFISVQGEMWKKLSEEDRNEWNNKAQEHQKKNSEKSENNDVKNSDSENSDSEDSDTD